MSLIHSPGDLPADVMHRAAAVVALLSEALCEGRRPGDDLTLSDNALHGLALITQALRCDLCRAAREI
jgi:hypothetical protein